MGTISFKEKKKILQEIENPLFAEADLQLLCELFPTYNFLARAQRDPRRYYKEILSALVEKTTAEEIRLYRRQYEDQKIKADENRDNDQSREGTSGGDNISTGGSANPEDTTGSTDGGEDKGEQIQSADDNANPNPTRDDAGDGSGNGQSDCSGSNESTLPGLDTVLEDAQTLPLEQQTGEKKLRPKAPERR
ncbi:MAG: hypothetical protein LIP08_06425 [Bacteroides sp.]|nr:hypothetical protein [Bacteroides sp.]